MKDEDGSLRWVIGDLAPHETKVVRVKATSEVVGEASDCVSVTYANTLLCALTKVVDPDLLLIKTGKTDGTICDDFWFTYDLVHWETRFQVPEPAYPETYLCGRSLALGCRTKVLAGIGQKIKSKVSVIHHFRWHVTLARSSDNRPGRALVSAFINLKQERRSIMVGFKAFTFKGKKTAAEA